MASTPHPADDDDEWIDLSTPEGNARWNELIAADTRGPQPLSYYAEHRAKRRAAREAALAEHPNLQAAD